MNKYSSLFKWVGHNLYLAFSRILYFLTSFIFQKKNIKYPKNIKKILIIRRNHMGDALNVLPLIEGIKSVAPHIEIHVLANPYNAQVFYYGTGIEGVHVIDEKNKCGKLGVFFHPTLKKIRRLNFDVIVALGGYTSFLPLLAWACGKGFKVGVRSEKGHILDFLYDRGVRNQEEAKLCHQVESSSAIVRIANIALPSKLPELKIKRPPILEEKLIALCPDVSRTYSQYPFNMYLELIKAIQREFSDYNILLILHDKKSVYKDLSQAKKCSVVWPSDVHDLMKTLCRCSFVITAEGGTSHLAPALNIPTIAISGVRVAYTWSPWSRHGVLLEKTYDISQVSTEEIMQQMQTYTKASKWLKTKHAYQAFSNYL
ncbi:MAG: glycosyltransferase family 9 protein [Deltaproteobacteria bacterium]|nr:glycosyltransferase family 9 protein [Deltaproteobacteria bacterium]